MNRHERHLHSVALMTAWQSRCRRAAVGCVVADSRLELFATGYNGAERGGPNECRRPDVDGGCGCLHAEINALLKAGQLARGGTAFVTRRPCEACAVALVNAGVARLFCPPIVDADACWDVLAGRVETPRVTM